MNRYQNAFTQLKNENRIAFIPFWMLGDPTPKASLQTVQTLAQHADILELGLPFSDPLADGPTIQAAVNRALEAGTNTAQCLDLIESIRTEFPEKPIGLLVYLNLIMQFGIEAFFARCAQVGVDSVLIPELPVEEVKLVKNAAATHNIDLVFLLSTNTPEDRRQKIYQHSGGFVYTVSKPSITGAQSEMASETLAMIPKLKAQTDLPICVGFGVSTPQHIQQLKTAQADGAIIGSQIIKLYQSEGLEAVKKFCVACKNIT